MSFTKTKYDECAYKKDLSQSMSVLDHIIEKNRYIHDKQCRHDTIGILQKNSVSNYNLPNVEIVDVESELYGLTRQNTRCPSLKYNKNQCKECKESKSECSSSCVKHINMHKKCTEPLIKYKKRVTFETCDKDGKCS